MPGDPGPSHPGEEAQQNDPDNPREGSRVETICCHVEERPLLDFLDRALKKKKIVAWIEFGQLLWVSRAYFQSEADPALIMLFWL